MTGYINKHENKNPITMSLRVNDEQLFKKYNKIRKKSWEVNENRFWNQTYLWLYDKRIKNRNKNICKQYNYKFS